MMWLLHLKEKLNKFKMKRTFDQRFGDFLQNEFCNFDKKSKGETHSWLFCWDGQGDEACGIDCGCCLTKHRGEGIEMCEGCKCICHQRIKDLKKFILREIKLSK